MLNDSEGAITLFCPVISANSWPLFDSYIKTHTHSLSPPAVPSVSLPSAFLFL